MTPLVYQLGGLTVTAYGAMACLGISVSYLLSLRRLAMLGADRELAPDLYAVALIGGVVMTRLFYVATYPDAFLADPAKALRFWEGGITYYGGLLGALGAGGVYLRLRGMRLGDTLDIFAPTLALGHALGRVGCFLHGCCYGVATDLPWGVTFAQGGAHVHRHPTQLYEAGLELGNALLLAWLWTRWASPGVDRRGGPATGSGGRVTVAWLGLYALQRFALEFLRADTAAEAFLFGTTFGQTCALVVGALALCWLATSPAPAGARHRGLPR